MKKILHIIFFLFVCATISAQTKDSVVIYFPKNSAKLDLNFRGNDQSVRSILDSLSIFVNDSVYKIKSITYSGAASPEGNKAYNERLADLRARSLFRYISNYTVLPDSIQFVKSLGRDWAGLIRLVKQDSNLPQREYVLQVLEDIVNNSASTAEDPLLKLMKISNGTAYKYMYDNIFPSLRATYFDIVYEKISKSDRILLTQNKKDLDSIVFVEVIDTLIPDQQRVVLPTDTLVPEQSTDKVISGQQQATQEEAQQQVQKQPIAQEQTTQEQPAQSADEVAPTQQPSQQQPIVQQQVPQEQLALPTDTMAEPQDSAFCRPFYMAIKSNMLYDLAMTPNAGIEFYLGAGFSLAANWQYAWWKRDKSAFYWRTYGGDVEARYWFGKLAKEKPLTGHHVGLYGQMITYDFEFGGSGILAPRWSWAIGASYGYSLPIHRVLNIDFSAGVGYHTGIYHDYIPIDGEYIWQATKRRRWIGPTKFEVSLVWLIGCDNYNKNPKFNKDKQQKVEENIQILTSGDKGGAL
jgi:outer membrane protein OmpA-like peptidoglycan-associated protein